MARPVVDEGRLADVDDEVDGATAAAVAAVGTTARDVRLTPKGGRTIAAIAGDDGQRDLVEEHRSDDGDRDGHRWSLVGLRPRSRPAW